MKANNPKISKFHFVLSIFFSIIILFSYCKKEDENTTDLSINVGGFWIASETITGDCHGSVETETVTEIFSAVQTGNKLKITIYPITKELNGTLNGDVVTWNGTIPTSSGNTTIDFSGKANSEGSDISGSASWTWSTSGFQCNGTTRINATKVTTATADFSGSWEGSWQSEEASYSGTFSVSVVQEGETLSGTINVPEIGMSNADLTGQVSGNVVFFGDVAGIIKFVGTLINNQGSGDYAYPTMPDEGSWTATKQ